ncbi:MAG: hypothetical protein J6J18_03595 [Oscillospiraceae bacterium]|nr:hypothetical protein [Oscillospiraceae bacterium]
MSKVSFEDFMSGAWKEEQATTPVSAPAASVLTASPQTVSFADFMSGAWKNQAQPQQTATPARDAQTQQRISQGLSTKGARQEKLFGKFLDRYFPQSRTSAAPRGLDPDSLAGQMMKDEANRYISNIKRYGSSTAWAEEMQKQYDSRTDKVESLSEQIRQLNLERHYGLMNTGENAEGVSWYDDQLTRLGIELGMAEREQSAAQKDLDTARGYAEYDTWKAQNDEDMKLLDMAHAAGLNSEGWYLGAERERQEAEANVRAIQQQIKDLSLQKVYGTAIYENGIYMGDDPERVRWYDEQLKAKQEELTRAEEKLRRKDSSLASATRTRYSDIGNDPNYAQRVAQGMMNFIQLRQEDQAAMNTLHEGQRMDTVVSLTTPGASVSNMFRTYQLDASYKRPTEKWTEEERKIYFYLLGSTEQPEEADRYAERLNEAYAQAEKFEKNKAIEEWAGQNILTGVAGTAASLGAFLVQGVDAIDKMVEYGARGTITTRPYTTATDLSNAVTAGVSGALNKWSGTTDAKILGKERGAGDLYQIAMSVAQSYAAIAAGGASGSLFFLGSGISNGIDEALDRGAEPGQAVAYGLTAGIVEVLAEKYSIDNLLGGMDVHSVVKSIAKQGGIEATEETVTTLLNSIADEIIMGDTSEYQQSMERYVMEGKTFSEASRLATRDWLNKIGESAVSGFISGGVSAGGMLAAEAFDVIPQSGTGSSGKPSTSPAVPQVQTEQKAEQAAAEQNKTAPVEGAEIKDETSYINNKLRENIPGLSDMQAVAQSRAEEVRQIPGKTMAEKARVLFEKIKGIVTRPGLGDVIINARSVKDDLSHGVGTAKAAVIPAIPEVIRQGKEIDYQEKWKGRNYDGYIFAAPVELDGETVYVAAVVKQTSKNKFYLHEVVDSNGNVIKINDGEEANQTSLMSPVDDAGASSPYNSPLESENSESVPSAESIAQLGEESNTPTAATEQAEPTTEQTNPITEQAEPTTEQTNPITERPEPEARKKAEAQPEIRESALALAEKKAQKDVRSFARRITEQLDSRRVYKDVAEDLEMMVHGMLSDEVSRSEVREWAGELAEYIVDNAEVTASDMSEERQRLVQYLRNTPLSMSRAEFGDIPKGWRSKHRAVRLTEKGLPINIAWRELGEMFGYGMFPEDMYSQSDMLMQIGHYLDSWADQKVNPHEQDRDGTVQSVAEDIFDTVSERVNKASVDALKADYKAELKAMREEERARAQGRIDKLTEQRDKARAEAQELKAGMSTAVKKTVQDERTRRAEQEEKQQHVKNIRKLAQSLGRKLEENSGRNRIPDALKRNIAALLAEIDTRGGGWRQQQEFASRIKSVALTLQKQQRIQEDKGEQAMYLDIPGDVADSLADIAERVENLTAGVDVFTGGEKYTWTISAMDNEDLAELEDILTSISHAVTEANNLFTGNGTVDQRGGALIRELEGRKAKERPGTKLEKAVEWDMMTPVYFFRRLGKPGEEMFKALRQGWGEFAVKTEQIIKASEEMWTRQEAQQAERELIKIQLPWRILEGEAQGESEALRSDEKETVKLTKAQAMSLYGLYRRPQGRSHILGAGIHIKDIERRGIREPLRQSKNYLVTEMDLAEIFSQLSEREKKIAEDMSRYMSTVGGEWGNTVTMKRWGIRGYTEETYWPIETDSRNRDARQPESMKNMSLFRLLNMGFTKRLIPNANNAVDIDSAFNVFANHMTDMAKYNTLALPLLDTMKILNYKEITARQLGTGSNDESGTPGKYTTASVQKSMDKVYGPAAQRYLMQLIQDLNGSREGGRNMTDAFGKLVSNYKAASVGANLRVAMLQPTSYVRASAVLDGGSLLYGGAHTGGWKEAIKYSGAAKWKNLGYRDSDINANVRELIKHDRKPVDMVKDLSMKAAEKMDQITWGSIWLAAKHQVQRQAENAGRKLSHEDLIDRTVELFEETIYRTQVMDSTLTRSTVMRSDEIHARFMTSFMAEPTLSYNMVLDEYANIVQESKKKGLKQAAMDNRGRLLKAMTVYTASMTAAAIAGSIADALRDDDEYETFMQKWWQAFWGEKFFDGNWYGDLSLVRKLPLFKPIGSLIDGYGSANMDSVAIQSIFEAWRAATQMLTEEEVSGKYYKDNKTEYGKINTMLKGLATLTGIPLYSASREVAAIWNTTLGKLWDMPLKSYDAGASSNIKYAFKDGTITEESARKLLVEEGVCDNEDEAYWKVEAWKSADGEYSKYDKLREAMKAGDKQAFTSAMQELEEHGMYHQSVISDGVVKEIQQMYQGNNAEQIAPTINKAEAVELLEAYGEKRNGEAEKIATQWTSYLEEGIDYSGMKEAYVNEQISFDKAVSMRSKYGMMSEADARAEVLEWQCYKETGIEADNLGKAYAAGELSWEELRDAYIKYEIYEEEKAASYADKAKFVGLDSYPGISYQATDAYWKYVPDMDKELYYQVWKETKDMKGEDEDGNGRSDPYTVIDKKLEYIDKLNLSSAQKGALAMALGISEDNLKRAPWNN